MPRTHTYTINSEWTGNLGAGTASYTAYSRDYRVSSGSKPPIAGSSDPVFRGDANKWNPEELLVGSLSACHQLWYLHLCAVNQIIVLAYRDEATATMIEGRGDKGRITKLVLRPHVTIARGNDVAKAESLHAAAHEECYIANSVNFPIEITPVTVNAL